MCSTIVSLVLSLSSVDTVRNEYVAEAMKQLELNFKQHTDAQLATYMKLLKHYMSTTKSQFRQLHQQFHELSSGKLPVASTLATKEDHDSLDSLPSFTGELSSYDISALLKVLKVDVPKFHGQHMYNWIYTIEKYFSLHVVLTILHLQVVAFHLEGEAASWCQWMDGNVSLIS